MQLLDVLVHLVDGAIERTIGALPARVQLQDLGAD